jgi:hypothetical protein
MPALERLQISDLPKSGFHYSSIIFSEWILAHTPVQALKTPNILVDSNSVYDLALKFLPLRLLFYKGQFRELKIIRLQITIRHWLLLQ